MQVDAEKLSEGLSPFMEPGAVHDVNHQLVHGSSAQNSSIHCALSMKATVRSLWFFWLPCMICHGFFFVVDSNLHRSITSSFFFGHCTIFGHLCTLCVANVTLPMLLHFSFLFGCCVFHSDTWFDCSFNQGSPSPFAATSDRFWNSGTWWIFGKCLPR